MLGPLHAGQLTGLPHAATAWGCSIKHEHAQVPLHLKAYYGEKPIVGLLPQHVLLLIRLQTGKHIAAMGVQGSISPPKRP